MREYLDLGYLDAERPSNSNPLPVDLYRTNADVSILANPTLLARLSADWPAALENAAVSGEDRAIATSYPRFH